MQICRRLLSCMPMSSETNCGKFLDREYCLMVRGLGMLAIVYGHTINEFMPFLEEYHLTFTLGLASLGTAICFFLSGYGLTMSFSRNEVDNAYVFRHLKGLFLPYLIFWLSWVGAGYLLGYFPHEEGLLFSFLTMAMPNADAWFFKTIVAIYIVYMFLRKFLPGHERTIITILILVYVVVMACLGMATHLWARVLCFPLGILFASRASMRRTIPLLGVIAFLLLTLATIGIGGHAILLTPLALMFFLAYASPYIGLRLPLLGWIGANSIYVYLMECIPIDFMDSQQVGVAVFVLGGIFATLLLSWMGRKVEIFVDSRLFSKKYQK